jgi:IMP dehydrogenase
MNMKSVCVVEDGLTFDDVSIIPKYSDIKTRANVDLSVDLGVGIKLNVPIIASPMKSVCEVDMAVAMARLGGIGIIHRFCTIDEQVKMVKDAKDILCRDNAIGNINCYVGAAIGVNEYEYKERMAALVDAGVDLINLDVAHGHHVLSKIALKYIKNNLSRPVHIMGGAVCTSEAVRDLAKWGVDSVRCGIGPGSGCTTRLMAGIGVPQVTAISNCSWAADEFGIKVIADGGIRIPGDVCKAIALGSDVCMLGGLLAATMESPGIIIKEGMWPNEKKYKTYSGSASYAAKAERGESDSNVEGASMRLPYKGNVDHIVNSICDGLKSSLSYVGVDNIRAFQIKSTFVKVSASSIVESKPHGLFNSFGG